MVTNVKTTEFVIVHVLTGSEFYGMTRRRCLLYAVWRELVRISLVSKRVIGENAQNIKK